jgi:type IV pilus assembly protein PilA
MMRRILRGVRHGQRGFTLVELLIVVAILGVIAAVVIPNVTAFMGSADLSAARTEAANVKTAALAYYADQSPPVWPGTSAALTGATPPYLTGTLTGSYTFDTGTGLISAATYGTTTLVWNATTQTFDKQAAP